jgi:hypothetical protein
MGLQRQRLVGGQHLDQERQHITEAGARPRAKLSLRIGDQRLQQRDFALFRFQPGRVTRVCTEPKLGFRVSRRNRTPGEFGDGGARSPGVRP